MNRAGCRAVIGLSLSATLVTTVSALDPTGGNGKRGPAAQSDADARRSLVQRPPAKPNRNWQPIGGDNLPASFPVEIRPIDGFGANPDHPEWGASGITLLRLAPADYDDGVGSPAVGDRGSARMVSNTIAAQAGSIYNGETASDYLWQWGQFLDHDLDETPIASPSEHFDIEVPMGDPWFDPGNTGAMTIPLDRSAFEMVDGVRQQLNNITAYIDASNVYGADQARADELRTMDGTGKLKTSPGNLLPFNVNGFPNAPTDKDPSYFLAGDIRCNEQIGLTAMHTMWVREHNHWADQVAAQNPEFDGDEIYQYARAIVTGQMQAITYNEFLPLLLGPDAIPPYAGYQPDVNPSISNAFATAAYRVGHTMLSGQLMRLDTAGQPIPAGHIELADAFFSPSEISDNGIDSVLHGLSKQMAQEIDAFIVDDVRNFLFGPPGAGGLDLASLNVQRGRDHGLADYNGIRMAFGLSPADDMSDITPDEAMQTKLNSAYGGMKEIDAWVGMLCEPHVEGAMVGETLRAVLSNQFTRVRDGDRFWYESYLPPELVALVEAETLARVIRRNTVNTMQIQDNVFIVETPCVADLNDDATTDVIDLLLLIDAWGDCPGCAEDLSANGTVGVSDLLHLLGNWGSCE